MSVKVKNWFYALAFLVSFSKDRGQHGLFGNTVKYRFAHLEPVPFRFDSVFAIGVSGG